MEELTVWPEGGQLWLKWKTSKNITVSEYVVEWVNTNGTDWQRENRSTRLTFIKGNPILLCNVKYRYLRDIVIPNPKLSLT